MKTKHICFTRNAALGLACFAASAHRLTAFHWATKPMEIPILQIMSSTYHSRISLRRSLCVVGALAALTLALAAVPDVAHAELVPCDPLFDCPRDPVYAPEQVAIGRDQLVEVAQDEAEEQAAVTCPPGGAYDVVRVLPHQLPRGSWRYTLTYRCEGPPYDDWP